LRREVSEGFRIEVWDQGPGISAEAWPQALQPFQRLDRARGGSGHCGLGLAIAARVAASHGGQLECRSSADGFAVVLRGRSVASGHSCVGSGNP
jgi:two-component system osmolarity sensor histidine kinase EnvZ